MRGFSSEHLKRLHSTAGLMERRVVAAGTTALDLGEAATRGLLDALPVTDRDIDLLIFVTQTPDYFQPCNAAMLHGRLGLANTCAAFDVNLGCSGYIYGLWLAHSLIAAGGVRRAVLVASDTLSRCVHPQDNTVAPLFGDAAAATLIEAVSDPPFSSFSLYTDGRGADSIIQPGGAFRNPASEEMERETIDAEGNRRRTRDLHMDGGEVFTFSITKPPECIRALLAFSDISLDSVDVVVLHQANRYILHNIAKRLKLQPEKVPDGTIKRFGNTSSTSIPLTLTTDLQSRLHAGPLLAVLCGFGSGLSWGAALVRIPRLVICGFSEYPESNDGASGRRGDKESAEL